jgi:signal transduction histidine kinase
MSPTSNNYYAMLKQAVFSIDPEEALTAAAACGDDFLKQGLPPESVAEIHHNAVVRLAQEHPTLTLAQVAGRLMVPFMEVSMAYSLAFRQQRALKSEQDRKQEQVSRLAAIGTLTAGIGHDFNTILGVVNGYAELLRDAFPSDSAPFKQSQRILDASLRARDLIGRMLTFARQAPIQLQRVDAVALIKDELKLVRAALPLDVSIAFECAMAQASMMATPSQIHQIMMNLCINAAHAMNGQGALVICIKQTMRRLNDTPERPCFSLGVADNGCGMTPEIQKRVLEPFFTTKELGKGTGLGLSVVFGIVSDLGGQIHIQSEIGVGTQFEIDLPLMGLD